MLFLEQEETDNTECQLPQLIDDITEEFPNQI